SHHLQWSMVSTAGSGRLGGEKSGDSEPQGEWTMSLWSRREVLAMGGAWALLGSRPARAAREYRALVLAGKPVGYWRLGEREGPVAHDETRHRRDGVFHGHVGYREPGALAGDADTSIRLSGHGAYVEVPDNEPFSQPASGLGMTV